MNFILCQWVKLIKLETRHVLSGHKLKVNTIQDTYPLLLELLYFNLGVLIKTKLNKIDLIGCRFNNDHVWIFCM